MFHTDIAPNDPRLTELRALVRDIATDRKHIAQIEARETRNLARAEALALELSARDAEDLPRLHGQTKREDFALQQVHAEIGAHIRVTDRTIARRMTDSSRLIAEYPRVMQAFGRGDISRDHATAIGDAGIIIDSPTERGSFEREMVQFARTNSVNRLRAVVRQVAERYADRDVETRLTESHAERSITIRPLDEGLSLITAVVPSVQGAALYDRLSQMARLVKRSNNRAKAAQASEGVAPEQFRALSLAASDERTVMQIRTDVFLDILMTGYPSAITCASEYGPHDSDGSSAGEYTSGVQNPQSGSTAPAYAITNAMLKNITAHVQVVIPLFQLLTAEQLAKLREIPGFEQLERFSGCNGSPDLAGYGPIPPDIARLLLGATSSWDRLLTNPVSGLVVAADQYSPTTSVRRSLAARDMHCRFPGCRVPTKRCDVDHTLDWNMGGKTVPGNLAHLCVKHHNLKHHSDWRVEQHEGGVMKWTSPLGTSFTDTPVSTVMFQAADSQSTDETTSSELETTPPPF